MAKHPYQQFSKKELILRDHLAIDRTKLANDRSFLAYIRTGFTISLTGITFLKLFDSVIFHVIGWVLLIIAVITIIMGYMKKRTMQKYINQVTSEN